MSAALIIAAALKIPRPARAESFDSLDAKAQAARTRGRRQEAVADLAAALKLWTKADGQKRRARALLEKSAIEERLGRLDSAIADLSQAVRISPRHADYFYRLGLLDARVSQDPKAIGEFYKAVALNISYKEAYFARAQAYARLGNNAFARQDYKTACGLGLRAACDVLDVTAPLRRRRRKMEAAFKRCRDFLSACIEAGASDSQCVKRAKSCGPAPDDVLVRGPCCPQACLSRFWALVRSQSLSEAMAYHAVFGIPRPACAEIP